VSLHWIVGTLHIMWRQQVGTQSSEAMGFLVQSPLGHMGVQVPGTQTPGFGERFERHNPFAHQRLSIPALRPGDGGPGRVTDCPGRRRVALPQLD